MADFVPRNLPLRGARNVRDLSDALVGGPAAMAPRVVLRSDKLDRLTAADARLLVGDYGLTQVIDLRTGQERDEKPDVELPGVTQAWLPVFGEATVGITREKRVGLESLGSVELPDMGALYVTMLREGTDAFAACLRLVGDLPQGESLLYRCTEGKDRTGVLSALLLSLLGATPDQIMADYLRTNLANAPRARRYYWLVLLLSRDRALAQGVHDVLLAKESYLVEALGYLEYRGGAERYARNDLGLTAGEVARLRERCLLA